MLALTFKPDFILRGVVEGLTYSLVALGLVLVYKATRVINFAHGQFGAFGAFLMATLALNYGLPYWLTFPLAVASGAAWGAVTELVIVRRLFSQPRLILFVATLGVSQLILFATAQLPPIFGQSVTFPAAINLDSPWMIWGMRLRGDQLMVLITVPLISLALAYLLTRTRFGQAVRASADNPNAASLAGISVRAVSTQVWIIAGALSAVSAVLIGPIRGANAAEIGTSLGPSLLLRALAAAMVGRLTSFPLAMLGGIGIGVAEVLLKTNVKTSGIDSLFVFLLLLILVLWRGRATDTTEQGWAFSGRLKAVNADIARLPIAKWTSRGGVLALLGIAALVPVLVKSPSNQNNYALVLIYVIVALSTTVLTGWAGQLSLGQFAFFGVGSYATAYYADRLPLPVALAIGTGWGALLAVIIGIPALRVRGLNLAVITLGFQLAANAWLFRLPKVNNDGGGQAKLNNHQFFKSDLRLDKRAYYYVCLFFVVFALFVVTTIRRSGIGRSILAVRDNEPSASAFTVSPTRAKLIAFGLSGGIAALAGGLYSAWPFGSFLTTSFTAELSLQVVAIAIVGGVVSPLGATLGTFVVVGIPTIFEGNEQAQLFASGVGMLLLLMYFPGGLIQLVHVLRDLAFGWFARITGAKPPEPPPQAAVTTLSRRSSRAIAHGVSPLLVKDVRVQFGGRVAVDNTSLEVRNGEVVGLIGTNGAGKSTLMNAISGFVPCTGDVSLFGREVGRMAAHRRARLGMGRAFQNAKLFGGLTVRETIMTALEARSRSLLVPSMFFLPPSPVQEHRKRKEADEIISYLGLGRYADTAMAELSTGTRRVVELASLIGLDARLFLLDEPTAGVAQRETEAFGPLIATIRKELGVSILLIEHDMPLVMSISDRIYCMEAGAVIAEGPPADVRSNPKVIASYLGTDDRAINRSDANDVVADVVSSGASSPSPL